MSRICLSLCFAAFFAFTTTLSAAQISAERSPGGVVIKIDGQFFTEYLTKSGCKPILWPIIGPTGKPMTRAYPMAQGTDEKKDHIHQRSLWFTHGDINGVNFWAEQGVHGSIEHREFVKVEGGAEALVVTRNDWLAPDGKRVCADERKFAFGLDGQTRRIDFDITVTASDGPVKFGDTKEGTMGLRIAHSMNVSSKLGGRIVNSDGRIDKDAWGKQAPWVDYYGPVDGKTVGIAILNHPSSFRFPTYWHVRDYGLFAANPFGLNDFDKSKKVDGAYTIPTGKSITLRYRILFHAGDEKAGKIAEAYAKYAKESK